MARCSQDIQEHINTLKTPEEAHTVDHEDHTLFTHAHDEQLLLWTQRYGRACMPWDVM